MQEKIKHINKKNQEYIAEGNRMTEEKIVNGCEFQSDCIEYKDISYLKVMPICAIHELSTACHDKVNKCKYYKLYKQLKRAEIEIEKLKGVDGSVHPDSAYYKITRLEQDSKELKEKFEQYKTSKQKSYETLQKRLNDIEWENKKLKEEIQFHNKENSNLLAERNAAQIGYDEIREIRERYRSALEEIRELAEKSIKISYNLEVNSMLYDIKDKINECIGD